MRPRPVSTEVLTADNCTKTPSEKQGVKKIFLRDVYWIVERLYWIVECLYWIVERVYWIVERVYWILECVYWILERLYWIVEVPESN